MKYLFNPFFLGSTLVFIFYFIVSSFVYDSYSIGRVMVITLLGSLLVYELFYSKTIIYTTALYKNSFIILFLYAAVQGFISSYINSEFELLQQIFVSNYFLLVVSFFLLYKDKKYTLNSYLLFIIIIISIVFLFIIFSLILSNTSVLDTLNHYFKNFRLFNHLQTVVIPSLGLALLVVRSEMKKVFILVLLIINFLFLFETGARGSSYAIFISYSLLLVSNLKSKRVIQNIGTMGSVFFISLLLYFTLSWLYSGTSQSIHLYATHSSGRADIYNAILPYLFNIDHLIYALGFSTLSIDSYHFLSPHNIFLYSFLGMGSLGFVFFIVLLIYQIIQLLSSYFRSKSLIKRYLLVILFSILIHACVSGIYLSPLTILLLIYFFLILSKYYTKKSFTEYKSYVNCFFVIGLVLSIFFLSIKNYNLREQYAYSKDDKGIHFFTPGIMYYTTKIFN